MPGALAASRFDCNPALVSAWTHEIEARHLPAGASLRDRRQFHRRLHLDDLILARACAQGQAQAWEEFWQSYQPRLRAAARRLTHDSARAQELADGLLGDLFGLAPDGTPRPSRLLSYCGLGSLEAWLCTLMARSHFNQTRQQRRHIQLDDCEPLQRILLAPPVEPALRRAGRQCVETAVGRVLRDAAGPARLLLCLYFLDGRTLAEIAVLLRVHESTVSRRLDRVLLQLRRQTRRELRRLGLRPALAEAALRADPRWLNVDVRGALRAQTQEGPHGL
ncbi:MAG: sigma factor-like helix-turn-helix DNA-binding protein [Terriglobales bacterium]